MQMCACATVHVFLLSVQCMLKLQYESAGRTLVSVGGVEFLSQLRGYCDPSLHSIIDDTLEHLLRAPLSSASKHVVHVYSLADFKC